MAKKEIERKIAVIFATDVVGYSKSVEVNEEQTIKNFRACKKILEDLLKNMTAEFLILLVILCWRNFPVQYQQLSVLQNSRDS